MIDPGRAIAGWIGRGIVLYLLALAVLVTADIARNEKSMIREQVRAVFSNGDRIKQFENDLENLKVSQSQWADNVNAQLKSAHMQTEGQLNSWLSTLDRQIAEKKARRLSARQKIIAAMTGRGLAESAKNELEIQALTLTRLEVLRVYQGAVTLKTGLSEARREFLDAYSNYRKLDADYVAKASEVESFAEQHPITSTVPFEEIGLGSKSRNDYLKLERERDQRLASAKKAWAASESARERWKTRRSMQVTKAEAIRHLDVSELQDLQALIDAEKTAANATMAKIGELADQARGKGWQALWWVLALLLMPFVLKAFWYYIMAPLAERHPPIRLRPSTSTPVTLTVNSTSGSVSERISDVSHEVRLGRDDELLVHPEYLQSLAARGRKETKLFLDSRYPFTSMSSGMVLLTRVRGDGEPYTVSSKIDPLAEVGVINLSEGAALVLQPRNLVGVVQPSGRAIRITSIWRFGLSAWVTLQFRYLIFEGPGQLIVRGCRGVRVERADSGRAIDQNATIGFSANLEYAPRRSETFSAYAVGVNGLFNDGFASGHGVYVYEEMPYYGKRSGITGRGLEGVTDLFLKLFGI